MGNLKKQLIFTAIDCIPNIVPGDDLAKILIECMENQEIELMDDDILVLAQKVVSKAEGRLVDLNTVNPSSKAIELAAITNKDPRFVQLVLDESKSVIRAKYNTLIVEHKRGFICANAGIDHSNVFENGAKSDHWALLLPEDADESARRIREKIQNQYNMRIGVLIIDSHGRAWRNGTEGVTIGLSGLPGLVDLRGQEDLFGFKLKVTTVGAADELAAGASLIMGQASEGTPAILVRGFPYPLRESSLKELIRPVDQDLFR